MEIFNSFDELFNAYGGGGLSSFFGSRVTDNKVERSVTDNRRLIRRPVKQSVSDEVCELLAGSLIDSMLDARDSDSLDAPGIPLLPKSMLEPRPKLGGKSVLDVVVGSEAGSLCYESFRKRLNAGVSGDKLIPSLEELQNSPKYFIDDDSFHDIRDSGIEEREFEKENSSALSKFERQSMSLLDDRKNPIKHLGKDDIE